MLDRKAFLLVEGQYRIRARGLSKQRRWGSRAARPAIREAVTAARRPQVW